MLSRYSTDFSFRNIILILFYISGISAAIYPILGIRFFVLVFGNTFPAILTVFVTYFLGVILGALFGGMYIDAKWYELKNFTRAEYLTGIYSIIFILSIDKLSEIYFPLFHLNVDKTTATLITNFIISIAITLPLSFLSGAKFSILGRYLVRQDAIVVRELAMMHSGHLFGLSLGSILAVLCVQVLGVRLSFFIVPVFNFINAATVKVLLIKFAHPQRLVSEFYDQQLKYFSKLNENISPFLKYFVLALNGLMSFVAVSYLVILFRPILNITSGNLFVQGLLLAFVFLSMAIGSFLVGKITREDRNLVFKSFLLLIGLSVFILLSVIYQPKIIIFSKKLWLQQYKYLSYFSFIDIIIFVFLSYNFIGMLLPLLYKIYLTKFERIGNNFGRFYASYFIGVLLAIPTTIYFLIPHIGTMRSAVVLATISLGTTVILFSRKPEILVIYRVAYAVLAISILVGFFMFTPDYFTVSVEKNEKLIQSINTDCSYSVHRDVKTNDLMLKVNGVIQGGTNLPYRYSDGLLVHLPMIFAENPDDVLVLGLGTGQVPWLVTRYPIGRVECCEPSDEIVQLSHYFVSINNNILNNQQFKLTNFDPVAYLQVTKRQYDVIILDYIHPSFFRNFIQYSEDFFQFCHKHLTDQGIIAVEVPMVNFSLEKLHVLVNTLSSSFENVSLWFSNNNLNYSMVLLGTKFPKLEIDFTRIGKNMQAENITDELKKIGLENVYELLDCYIMEASNLKQLSQKQYGINRFSSPYFKYTVLSDADYEFAYPDYLRFLNKHKEPVFELLTNIEASGQEKPNVKSIMEKYYKGSNYVFDGLINEFNDDKLQALQVYRMGFKVNPVEKGVNRFLNAYYDPQLIPDPQNPAEFVENGKIFYQKMNYQKSIEMFEAALIIDRQFAPAYFGLGINYEVLNDFKQAKRMYARTIRLRPKLTEARERLNKIEEHEKEVQYKIRRGLLIK
ncbi:fused MFS/spermidine synthase [candidate division KSB1 bacterium]|nr:fused MFS/spermidine synthase [candidate division KSB1 bacterium]